LESTLRSAGAVRDLGNESRNGGAGDRSRSRVKSFAQEAAGARRTGARLHGLDPGNAIENIAVEPRVHRIVHNSRIEDLGQRREWRKGNSESKVRAMVVPGSQAIKRAGGTRRIGRIFSMPV